MAIDFVKRSSEMTQCPHRGCDGYVGFSKRRRTVKCCEGHRFCFACGQDAHAPVSCAEAKAWRAYEDSLKV